MLVEQINESHLGQAFCQDAGSGSPGADCPSADELWKTCTLELGLQARTRIVDHCIHCAHCAQGLRVTREMVEEYNAMLEEGPANTPSFEVPRLSLAERGAPSPLRIVPDEPGGSANQDAQASEKTPVSLGDWRRHLNKITAGCGVVAAAAALAVIVFHETGPGAERGNERDSGAWRGRDKQSQGLGYQYAGGSFSWPQHSQALHYELEIKRVSGSSVECVQVVPRNNFVLEPSLCPGISMTGPFFWRVRPVTKEGPGEYSRYFAAKSPAGLVKGRPMN